MQTTTEIRYSRALALDVDQVQVGDQVSIATDWTEPMWRTVLAVGACEDDPEDDSDHCDGDCARVLTLQVVEPDGCDPRWWHVQHDEGSLLVRVVAE